MTRNLISTTLLVLLVFLIIIFYNVVFKFLVNNRNISKKIIKISKKSFIIGSIILIGYTLIRFESLYTVYQFVILMALIYVVYIIFTIIYFIVDFMRNKNVSRVFLVILNLIMVILIIILPNLLTAFQMNLIFQSNQQKYFQVVRLVAKSNLSSYNLPELYKGLSTSNSIDIFRKNGNINVLFYINIGVHHFYDAILYTSKDGTFIFPENDKGGSIRKIRLNWYIISSNTEYRFE